MNVSRISSFLYAIALSCTVLSSTVDAQSMSGQDSTPSLIDPSSTPLTTTTPPPQDALPSSQFKNSPSTSSDIPAADEGKNRLRSAYDRSSNPAYYNMLDRLERNQKRKKHGQINTITPATSTTTDSEKAPVARELAHSTTTARHHHRKSRNSHHHHRSSHTKHHRSSKKHHAAKHHHGKAASHSHHLKKAYKHKRKG